MIKGVTDVLVRAMTLPPSGPASCSSRSSKPPRAVSASAARSSCRATRSLPLRRTRNASHGRRNAQGASRHDRARRARAGPAHGYAVIQEIRRKTGEAFDLPEGTIYPVLHRLEQAGLLASTWVTAETGRRRRVYALTKSGNRALAERRAVWQQFCDAIGGLLGGARPHEDPA